MVITVAIPAPMNLAMKRTKPNFSLHEVKKVTTPSFPNSQGAVISRQTQQGQPSLGYRANYLAAALAPPIGLRVPKP